MKILLVILVFGIIILIHEFGHFIVARLNKIPVIEFSIGMGPKIVSWEKEETTYSIRWLPIGGYCMMEGENEESENENAFCNQPVFKRILVILAGPVFNFILAFILSIVLCHFCGIDPPEITVIDGGAAMEAGLQDGDIITGIGKQHIINYREVLVYMSVYGNSGEPIDITYLRGNEKNTVTITPKKTADGYKIGVMGGYKASKNIFQDVEYGAFEVRYWIKSTVMSLKMLFTGKASKDDLMGPVGVGNMMGEVIDEAKEQGGMADVILNIINFCVLLSANLGVMNLLPIPALDGGRFLFLLIEAVTRKPVPKDKEAIVNGIGFVLLMILMIFVFFNDISNVFFKK